MNKNQPIFISFYTNNGKYPKKAKVLEKSLKHFNLRYDLVPLNKNFNSWLDTVCYKATFIFDSLLKYRSSVVWLDIDNEIWQFPSLLFNHNDFAIYNWYADKDHHLDGKIDFNPNAKKLLCSGGVQKYGYTAPSIHLLLHWINLLKTKKDIRYKGDDQYLDLAFNSGNYDLKTLWLPKTYMRMDKHSIYWTKIPNSQVVINNDYSPSNHGDGRSRSLNKGF